MICEMREEIDSLLHRLPSEVHLDLSEAAPSTSPRTIFERKSGANADGPYAWRARIFQELFGCGPLTNLLEDKEITEIIVNGASSVWYEKGGRMFQHEDCFHSVFTLSQFVHLICREARLRLDLNQPFADGTWRGLRVHLSQSPLVDRSRIAFVCAVIRVAVRVKP